MSETITLKVMRYDPEKHEKALTGFIADLPLGELLGWPEPGIFVAGHCVDAVGFEEFGVFLDNRFRRKRRPALADEINNRRILLAMTNAKRETVGRATAWIGEGDIMHAVYAHLSLVMSYGHLRQLRDDDQWRAEIVLPCVFARLPRNDCSG